MPNNIPTSQDFLKDVARHQMTIAHEDGLHRHITFKRPETNINHFHITTWPGYLCISGDMGAFVFARLPDMFQFFRKDRGYTGERPAINLSYWAEKLQAIDNPDGHRQYSPELFRQRITEWLDDMEASDELREAVDDEVMPYADDGEALAMQAALQFKYDGEYQFSDFYGATLKTYTYRFVWCCYAIAWAVEIYDASKRIGE